MRRLALCALAALFVLTGCKAEVKRHVLIIGDSITDQSIGIINHELLWVPNNSPSSVFLATYDAISGIGVRTVPNVSDAAAWWDVHLASVVEHVDPEAYVIALGTNDCVAQVGDNYGNAVDFMLSRLPADKPVFWLTIPDINERDAACVAAANQAIVDAPARWSNLHVWDLRAALGEDPANYDSGKVHLSSAGVDIYATFLHDRLDAAFDDTTTTTSTSTTTSTTTTTTTTTTAAT